MADEEKYGYYRTRDEDGNLTVELHGDEAKQPKQKAKGSVGAAKKTGTSATEAEKED